MSVADEHARYRELVTAAQKKLDAAVEEFFTSCEYAGVMTSWALVAHHAGMIGERGTSSYGLVTMHDSQPFHIIEGLLRQGIREIDEEARIGGGIDIDEETE